MQLDFQQFRTKMEKMTLRRFGKYFDCNNYFDGEL